MRIIGSLVIAAAVALSANVPALAQGALNPQQQRMKDCNADASAENLKGDAREQFMSTCLKAKPGAATNSQQEKMKACNAQATAKKLDGDPRRKFMVECLRSGS